MADVRRTPRAPLALPVTLRRTKGAPVSGETVDVSRGGARVRTERPLRVDELLAFDLRVGETTHVDGRCRVLRQQGFDEYALRFEEIDEATLALLSGVVDRAA